MKKLSLILVLVLLASMVSVSAFAEWKPEQPITIMNHVAAGGAMDL